MLWAKARGYLPMIVFLKIHCLLGNLIASPLDEMDSGIAPEKRMLLLMMEVGVPSALSETPPVPLTMQFCSSTYGTPLPKRLSSHNVPAPVWNRQFAARTGAEITFFHQK